MKNVFLALALTIAPIGASALSLGPFDELVVFGDSLSDPGNAFDFSGGTIPAPPLYPDGQFTDGDVWSKQLGADVGSGRNFAFGGAKAQTDLDLSPDFALQRLAFELSAPSLGAKPLAAVFFGGNDLRGATPADAPARIVATVSAITTGVSDLIDLGLSDILVLGLPNLGRLPNIIGTAEETFAREGTIAFNGLLQASIAPLNARANVMYFDTFAFFEDYAEAANLNGVIGNDTCLNNFPTCNASNAGDYLWIDDVHPTEGLHTALAQAISVQLVPLPSGILLLLSGIAGIALIRRK